jgi:UDP-glucose 4-epimerase
MKIIVTGGAGFIGSHLVDRLARERAGEIVVLDNLARGRRANLAAHTNDPAVRLVEGDVRDGELLKELFAGADCVYHLAAQSNVMGAVSDIGYSFNTNVAGTFNMLEAARANGVRRVVFASSREVYGEPEALPVAEPHALNAKNAYGASKAAGELYCRVFHSTYGLETAVLRLANVYGPRDRDRVIPLWFEAAAAGRDLVVYGGAQVIDFVWVDQVVEALVRAATANVVGQPINVASGRGTPILELAERILAISGARSRLDRRPARSVEVARFVADVSRMRATLELEPPDDPLFALARLRESYEEAR